MSIRLIVNSDDYGRTPEVSRGIRAAHLRGIVTSTTVMLNMPAVEDDLRLALQETPRLGLGVHLVLTSGRPVLPVERAPSLVGLEGSFHKLETFTELRDELSTGEIQAEWRAQVEKFVAVTGRAPTHLDSHHHSSYFTPALFRSMLELAREYRCAIRLAVAQGNGESMAGLPAEVIGPIREYAPKLLAEFRPRCPDAFHATFYDELATLPELLRIIGELGEGSNELMCHPGYTDAELLAGSVYARQREGELAVLTDPRVRELIQQRGIQLITFAEL